MPCKSQSETDESPDEALPGSLVEFDGINKGLRYLFKATQHEKKDKEASVV